MPDGTEQARAYLSEAETTLESARVLFEHGSGRFAPQIVKNAYDAMEQALSAGIAYRGEDIPRRHNAKIQRYFEPLDADDLERTAFRWHARRSDAQYVDFKGKDLSVPSSNFDHDDAREIIEDTKRTLAFVRGRIEEGD